MKNGRIAIALTVVLLLGCILCMEGCGSKKGTNGLDYLEITENGTTVAYAVSGLGSAEDKDIVIPDKHNGLPVQAIAPEAFCHTQIESIHIPSSVKIIGEEAFYSCRSLKKVTFAENSQCSSIEEEAFGNCGSLQRIHIPSSVTSIAAKAFVTCDSLESVVVQKGNPVYHSEDNCLIETESKTLIAGCKNSIIPTDGSVTSIGYGAFAYCSLTSIVIPASVTSIGDGAFVGCSSLTSIEIPSSVTSIGRSAFMGCSSLTSIEIPSSVTSIGHDAFGYCSLTSIVIPASVTSIGDGAFTHCSSLTSIVLPTSVTSIGWSAFMGCSSLTSIEIPSSVTSIGSRAFMDCSSLTSIKIPSSVTSIDYGAFMGCDRLKIYCEVSDCPWGNDNWNCGCEVIWNYKG